MKVNIVDPRALGQVRPKDLRSYLARSGWTRQYSLPNRPAEVWASGQPVEQDRAGILVPTRRDVRDYPERISRILGELERQEQRTQLDIWSDLVNVACDLFTVRAIPRNGREGQLPIDVAKTVLDGTLELLVSSACSAVSPKPYYRTRKPSDALDWIDQLKMGQTRPGSYVFTFLIDAGPPGLLPRDAVESIELRAAPYQRKVLGTAATALDSVVRASSEYEATGELTGFAQDVPKGVSANFCDGLGAILETDALDSVEFKFSWALESSQIAVPSRTSAPTSIRPVLEKASEMLKESGQPDVREIEGYVVRLAQEHEVQDSGDIAIYTLLEEGPRRVIVSLSATDYHHAIEAHRRKRKVICGGDVRKVGSRFVLQNPHDFREA
jgi:hypothetical protein